MYLFINEYCYICFMKLSQWAKEKGLSYQTAWRHFKNGQIKGAYKLSSGTIIVPNKVIPKKEKVVIYARVSSNEQKEDLKRQEQRLINFCNANGWIVSKSYTEIASGLNDKRVKFGQLLLDDTITKIVIEHKDRAARFGLNYIESMLKSRGTEIVIMNKVKGDENELMQDFVAIITSFVARLYGQRRSKRKKEEMLNLLKDK